MRYKKSKHYRHAEPSLFGQFIGLKSKKYEGRAFEIDEHDARMVVANIPKRDFALFKKEYKKKPYSAFRLLQDFEFAKKRKRSIL